MIEMFARTPHEVVFRAFLPWFLMRNAVLIGLGTLSIWFAVHASPMWWAAVILAACVAVRQACTYASRAVILRGGELVFRYGLLEHCEQPVPLLEVDWVLDQSIGGRLFDYGTVRQHIGNDEIIIPNVASLRALRLLVAERRQLLRSWR